MRIVASRRDGGLEGNLDGGLSDSVVARGELLLVFEFGDKVRVKIHCRDVVEMEPAQVLLMVRCGVRLFHGDVVAADPGAAAAAAVPDAAGE